MTGAWRRQRENMGRVTYAIHRLDMVQSWVHEPNISSQMGLQANGANGFAIR